MRLPVLGKSDISVTYRESNVLLKEVLLVSQLHANLRSVSAITKRGEKVNFCRSGCQVYNRNVTLVFEEKTSPNNIYTMALKSRIQVKDLPKQAALSTTNPKDHLRKTMITLYLFCRSFTLMCVKWTSHQ